MKTRVKLFSLFLVAFTGAIIFYACNKNDSAEKNIPQGKQEVSLFLTDHPFFFDAVMVDIKSVKVLVDTCDKTTGWRNWDDRGDRDSCLLWDSLNIKPGIYDLLTLRNGTDTLLANGILPQGRIRKIKIELGTNNSLVKDSVSYPLHIKSGDNVIILKLFGNEWDQFANNRFRIWMDFDVHHSIIQVRNNEFWLRPVIKLFILKSTGSISGKVGPKESEPIVTVYNGTDSAYALPWWGGEFKVRGLKEGTYSVFINGSNGYKDTTISNVTVTAGKDTKLGNITLHK